MQGGDRQGQLVDHGGVDGVGDHPQGVIAGTHDTGDVGGGLASLHVDGGVIVHVLGNQVRQGGTSGLSLHGGPVPVVGVADGQGEVLHSGVLRQAGESPACSGLGHGGSAAATLFNGSHHIVHDLLSEGHQAVVHSGPESGLLLLGHQGEVGVVLTQLAQQGGQGNVVLQILLQAPDGQGAHGGVAVIGGVQVHIDAEDHIVDGGGLAVGEDDVVPHSDVVVHGALGLTLGALGDHDVGGAVVGVVGAVVLAGLALDAVEHGVAHTVDCQQAQLGQAHDLVIGVGQVEEGGELTLQALLGGHHQGGGLVGVLSRRLGVVRLRIVGCAAVVGGVVGITAAAGQQAQAHDQCEKQRQEFSASFHSVSSYVYSELCKRDYAHSSRIAGARRAPGGGDRPPSAYSGGPRSVSRSGAKQKELCIRSPFRRARAGAARAARRIRRHSLCKMSAGEKDGLPPGGRGEMSGRS